MGCGRDGVGGRMNDKGCVCEVVHAILEIQNHAKNDDCSGCTTNCFLEPLGGIVSPARKSADTRVFTLLTETGKPFMAMFSSEKHPDACTSMYFRVEDMFDDCCATLRVLIPLTEEEEEVNLLSEDGAQLDFHGVCDVKKFAASNSCVTVDLSRFTAVQCIMDVDLCICN